MNKQEIVSNFLTQNNIDALLITENYSRIWYANLESTAGEILVTKNSSLLMIDGRYAEFVKTKKDLENISDIYITDRTVQNTIERIKQEVQKHNIKSIGLESEFLSYDLYNFFSKILSDIVTVVPVKSLKLRFLKDEKAFNGIKKGADVLDLGIKHIQNWIKPGVSEIETAIELEYFFKKQGIRKLSFDTIVAFGKNSALPHANPSNTILQQNDIVLIDCGVVVDNFASDQTRCFFLNNPDPKLIEIYNIVKEAQSLGVKSVKAGIKCCDLDKIVRDYISSKGYGEYYIHGLGHGLGVDVHEPPYLNASNKQLLEVNNAITIEPGIYVPGLGGVRIEDDVRVYENEGVVLNSCSKELIILKK